MTKVIHLASRRAGNSVQLSAQFPNRKPTEPLTLDRQAAIENALALALYHIRQHETPGNIHAATVRAVRAASMLKQASEDAANPVGRAQP